jgi:guanine deaminase
MEKTQLEIDKHFMQLAIDESKLGNYPYGAVLVKDNEVKFKAHNTVTTDPTAHAEVTLIRMATKALGTSSLAGYTLYTSSESCPMCAAAEVWAKVDRVVFGASIEQLIQVAQQKQIYLQSNIVNSLWTGSLVEDRGSRGAYELTGGILASEALQVFAK